MCKEETMVIALKSPWQRRPCTYFRHTHCDTLMCWTVIHLCLSYRSKKESSESAVDGRLLAGLVQDVWDKCHQQKLSLLSRQKHEAEALLVVQRAQWIDHLTKTGK